MRYNPSTDRAQLLDELAAQTKAVIAKLVPPRPRDVVWDPCLGRYVDNSAAVSAYLTSQSVAGTAAPATLA